MTSLTPPDLSAFAYSQAETYIVVMVFVVLVLVITTIAFTCLEEHDQL